MKIAFVMDDMSVHSNGTSATAERYAEALRKHGYTAKMHVISNGVPKEFCPGPGEPFDDGLVHVVTVGRLSHEKGQLIDWWLDNPDKIEEWSPKYAAEGMSDHVDKCAARFVGMLQEAIADAKA